MSDNDDSTEQQENPKKMATIHDVSLMANVSNATVSRVFNGNAKVKSETRELVLKAARKLGYNPEKLSELSDVTPAVSAVSTHSNTIGMVVSQLSTSSFGQFYLAAQQHAIQEGKQLMLFNGEGVRSREKSYVKLLVEQGCEVILLVETEILDSEVEALTALGQTVIRFDSRHDELAHSLSYDHSAACHSACQFLIANKHQNFALFPGKGKAANARIRGYKQAMEDYGLEFDPRMILEHVSDGNSGVMELCRKGGEFSAIVSATDKIAAEAMATLRQFGYEVPEDISIISLEGSELAEFTYPRLTTVETPVSYIAAELIDASTQMLEGREWGSIQDKCLTGRLVPRESVKPFKAKSQYGARLISTPRK
ncbi:LacI family DNA-binding transcriptional regulator [Vibrio maerlii]|uniref:LacI family DNA-binding transcriptional regulator n=1 Tax=Vibrio maerlii TaxID=2231648 RepID=UPI000E3C1DE2|nr:LacI family DNA-binding transcriptional regulator [Vibrio maerlii]